MAGGAKQMRSVDRVQQACRVGRDGCRRERFGWGGREEQPCPVRQLPAQQRDQTQIEQVTQRVCRKAENFCGKRLPMTNRCIKSRMVWTFWGAVKPINLEFIG